MSVTAEQVSVKVAPAHARKIRKAAVLGSGVMGSRIACHFANIGLDVVLLDIVPFDLKEEEKNSTAAKNKIVNAALDSTIKSNPSPIYDKAFLSRIKTGNFDDNMSWISDCDWIIEVVVENLEIKKSVFEKVEKFRKPGTLITSNTSGIPIEMMIQGRSEDFQAHFCGTHFFNPPRYLRLFEIIPSSKTNVEVVNFFKKYADVYLGKTPVLCKDTPAFIANRVGVFSMMAVFHLLQEMDMRIDDVDALTGTFTGKPKSASFRTGDVVGLDTLVKVADGVFNNCPNDEEKALFNTPGFIKKMVENKWLGDKTGKGFYFKDKSSGKKDIQVLDWKTLEYVPQVKTKWSTVEASKPIENLSKRLAAIDKGTDKAADFLRKLNHLVFKYVSNRVPEIADKLFLIDDGMRAGFGWELGPFEQWDAIGVENVVAKMKEAGMAPAAWVAEMLAAGIKSFYTVENGVRKFYDIVTKQYQPVEGRESFIILENLRGNKPVWKNTGCVIHDIGDGVLNVEFRTKMNALGGEIIEGLNKAIDIAEKDFRGVVIGNEAPNFSAGANLAMIFMLAIEQEYDELDMVVRQFQNGMMRLRHSAIPVVAAPHGLTLGGGCEVVMHCDAAVAAAETYIGLVEVGVGLIPAGGGTKEFAMRAADSFKNGDPMLPSLADRFTAIATAKTATAAHEGFALGVFDKTRDTVCVNPDRVIAEAKRKVLELSEAGYVQPRRRDDIYVLGRTGLAGLYAGVAGFEIGGYATAHDKKIAEKVAYVMCGGDLSSPTKVTDQYLLDLEREAFLSLLGEKKTLERIQSILTSGKPLRN